MRRKRKAKHSSAGSTDEIVPGIQLVGATPSRGKTYRAIVTRNGERVYLGSPTTLSEAQAEAMRASKRYREWGDER